MSPAFHSQSTGRWFYIGIVLAWLMILGGLIGVMSGLSGGSGQPYLAVVVCGALLNAILLNVARRRETAHALTGNARDAAHRE